MLNERVLILHSAFSICMDGLLVINKPSGKTSHDIVYLVRRITGEKRVGHAGTLDPLATGVLVICLGQAVRVSEYLINHDKTYRARVRLGIETDTYDATGRVTATRQVDLPPSAIATALDSFVGKIYQTPPAHSAIQRDGVRSYKLARRGIEVEMEPRQVDIHSIRLREIHGDDVEFDVHCGKGTFVRSLAHDLGAKLGVGAHLAGLVRLASGPFTIEESLTIEEFESATLRGDLARHLLPLDRALTQLDALNLGNADAQGVRQGRFIQQPGNLKTPVVRAYDENGQLVGLLEDAGNNMLKPKKVFAVND